MTPLQTYFPIGIVLLAALLLAVVMLTIAGLLGPRRYSQVKAAPFECGSTLTLVAGLAYVWKKGVLDWNA